jgi:hypothetical protein
MGERVGWTAQRAHLNVEEPDSGSAEEVNKVAERAGEDMACSFTLPSNYVNDPTPFTSPSSQTDGQLFPVVRPRTNLCIHVFTISQHRIIIIKP